MWHHYASLLASQHFSSIFYTHAHIFRPFWRMTRAFQHLSLKWDKVIQRCVKNLRHHIQTWGRNSSTVKNNISLWIQYWFNSWIQFINNKSVITKVNHKKIVVLFHTWFPVVNTKIKRNPFQSSSHIGRFHMTSADPAGSSNKSVAITCRQHKHTSWITQNWCTLLHSVCMISHGIAP